MRLEQLVALAMLTALPPENDLVLHPAPCNPEWPGKAPHVRGTRRHGAYIGERVHVNANPDEVRAIVSDLHERRRLNNLRKIEKGAVCKKS